MLSDLPLLRELKICTNGMQYSQHQGSSELYKLCSRLQLVDLNISAILLYAGFNSYGGEDALVVADISRACGNLQHTLTTWDGRECL